MNEFMISVKEREKLVETRLEEVSFQLLKTI